MLLRDQPNAEDRIPTERSLIAWHFSANLRETVSDNSQPAFEFSVRFVETVVWVQRMYSVPMTFDYISFRD